MTIALNGWNGWSDAGPNSPGYADRINMLCSERHIVLTEGLEKQLHMTAAQIKQRAPGSTILRCYTLCALDDWNTDFKDPNDLTALQIPLTWAQVKKNDWYLRDGNGNIVWENEHIALLDVGKPGFPSTYARQLLAHLAGTGVNAPIFDYASQYQITSLLKGRPRPAAYPTDQDWFDKAWWPFIKHITDELHEAGYPVFGNCVGMYGTNNKYEQQQRALYDGTVLEEWAFRADGTPWPSATVDQHIQALQNDPLVTLANDFGCKATDKNYDEKVMYSACMFLVAYNSQKDQSWNVFGDGRIHRPTVADMQIGRPIGGAIRQPSGTYIRPFEKALVVFNPTSTAQVMISPNSTFRAIISSALPSSTLAANTGRIISLNAGGTK